MLESLYLTPQPSRFKNLNQLADALLAPSIGQFDHILRHSQCAGSFSHVFAIAYRSALQRLLPQLKVDQWAAFSVTEEGGNHPRSIASYLEAGRVFGKKTFVSMGELAQQVIVIAKEGESNGRPNLKAVLLESTADHVTLNTMPPLGLLNEIPHGELILSGAKGVVLPGDGHSDYSQVFRWHEDVCLLTSFSAYFHGFLAGSSGCRQYLQVCLSLLSRLHHLHEPSDVNAILLQSCFDDFRSLVLAILEDNSNALHELKLQVQREQKLFSLAKGAREARTERAWARLYPQAAT